MGKFSKLGLSDEIVRVITEMGFEEPTDIQKSAIPRLLAEDRDLIGLAQTGTGKTAAFGLPLIERIDPTDGATQGLILAPTRELGKQIAEQLNLFSKYLPKINVLAVYGGASIMDQIRALRKPQHIIIATPGRLIDLIKRKAVRLEELRFLVLDEADEMLNMGFKDELEEILSFTPEEKLTWLFSATMPGHIKKIVKKYMDDPIDIRVNTKQEVNKNIKHLYTKVKNKDKMEALTRFIDIYEDMRGVVFCRTRSDTQRLAEDLLSKGYKADAIHGDLSQAQRERVMKRFKKGDLAMLIATDVAARGIDVNDLTHVFHHSLPDDNAYYTHRSGRTARAGKKGISMIFVNGSEEYKVRRIEKQLDISIKKIEIPDSAEIARIRINRWAEKLLDPETKIRVPVELLSQAYLLLVDMSKEDIIAHFLSSKMKNMNLGSSKDLNDSSKSSERSERGGGYGRRRGGRDRSRNRDRDRSSSRSRAKRSGGGSSSGGKDFKGKKKKKSSGGSSYKSKSKKK